VGKGGPKSLKPQFDSIVGCADCLNPSKYLCSEPKDPMTRWTEEQRRVWVLDKGRHNRKRLVHVVVSLY